MKTLKNQTLLYDEDCPLCRVYTSGFIKAKMLDENGKKPYCQLSAEEQSFIDVQRASNEIALVDNQNKTVTYGVDSLLKVIGFSFPIVEKIGNLKPIKFLLKKLYSFISYNRKVIIPGRINKEMKLQCVPDFSYKYRILFIIFATFCSLLILKQVFVAYSFWQLVCILSIIFGVQCILFVKISKHTMLNYFGNFAASCLVSTLFFMPSLALKSVFGWSQPFIQIGCVVVLFFFVFDISRRVQIIYYNSK